MAKIYEKVCGKCGEIVRYAHRQKPDKCPYCGSTKFDKPKTEVDLFELQDHYLLTREDKYLVQMYEILKSYAKSLIYKIVKGQYHFDSDEIEQKSHDAAMGIVVYYLNKPEFRIDHSFAGYLIRKVKEVLYSTVDEDDHDSLNYRISYHGGAKDDGNSVEKEDLIFEAIHKEKPVHDNESVLNEFMRLITKVVDTAKQRQSKQYAVLMLIAFYYNIVKVPNSFISEYYAMYGQDINTRVDASMKEILIYLQESLGAI